MTEEEELAAQRQRKEELEAQKRDERRRREARALEKLAVAEPERERLAQERKQECIAKAQRRLLEAARLNPFDWVDGKLHLEDFMD